MRYRDCIFDLYGTLVDIHTDEERPQLWEDLAAWYQEHGAPYAPEELQAACASIYLAPIGVILLLLGFLGMGKRKKKGILI